MRRTVTIKFENTSKPERVYVEYDITAHGSFIIQDVQLPGDLLSIMDRLTKAEVQRIAGLLARPHPRKRT